MSKIMCLKLLLVLCALVTLVRDIEAINDPAFEGIKTKSNRGGTYLAQQQQPQYPASRNSHQRYYQTSTTTTFDDTATRLSPIYEAQERQQQHQGSHYYQQELPLFERNTQERHAVLPQTVMDVENAITEYYTGCPSHFTGQLPYAYDCRRFLNCWNGRGHIQSCGPGTVFNPDTMECDRPDKVICGTLSALGGLEQQQKTPKYRSGRYLDAQHTGSINVLCPMGVTGLQPHPTDCTKFLNCANGNVHVQSCGPGTAYSISMMVCDFKHKVDCSGRNAGGSGGGGGGAYDQSPHSNSYDYNYRDSKRYPSDGAQDGQWGGHRETRPSNSWAPTNQAQAQFQPPHHDTNPQTGGQLAGSNRLRTDSAGGDRWSNMNFQRPTAGSYGSGSAVGAYGANQNTGSLSSAWSGTASSVDGRTPAQNVLYVEGSLQPNRNYAHSFSAPLAPMSFHSGTTSSTTTANVYYAQPVGSQEDSEETFSNVGGDNQRPPPTYTRQNHSRNINYSNTDNPWTPIARPNSSQSHGINVPNPNLMPPHVSSPPATHLMPQIGSDLRDQGQQPKAEPDYPSAFNQYPAANVGAVKPPVGHLMPPLSTDSGSQQRQQELDYDRQPSASRSRPTVDASNLYGGLQPPLPTDVQTTTTPQNIDNYGPLSYPSTTTEVNTTPRSQLNPPIYPTPPLNSPPPNSNVRTFQIYPPTSNVNDPQYRDPHYSPPYANVAHSRNVTWLKTASSQAPHHVDASELSSSDAISPSSYNRQYYPPTNSLNPNSESAVDDGNNQLPISDAIRMLLRPYFNRSGTVTEDVAEQAESHIMQLISTTTPRTTSTTAVSDVELILAGEQHSLASVVPIKEGTHEVKIENQDQSNWHTQTQTHNRDFHLKHPNLPNPLTEDERSSADPRHTKNPHHHYHHHHHHHHHHQQQQQQQHDHQHSREFHRTHPNLPNPFTTNGDENIDENSANINPNAESTTSVSSYEGIDIRSFAVNNQCQFDCGNGKCIQSIEVCDGINNCGNRRDESQCAHLGYKVRLTGGESSNMGRIEVQISGKWGYVCDDKFGLRDADVVCKELGFKQGASEVRGNSFYPPTEINFKFVMDEVDCQGNETSLKDCNFKGWGANNCGPDEVVGVVCKVPLLKCPNDYWLCSTSKECIPPAFVCDNTPDCADKSDESAQVCNSPIEYRLVGGLNTAEGRLEVRYRGEWGTVCDDDFGVKEAQVMCHSLGYYGVPKVEKNIFGPGSGPIWLDQVSCYGNESTIDQCNHWTWGEHNCNHTEDVGIKCTVGSAPHRATTSTSNIAPDATEKDTQQQIEDRQTEFDDIGFYPLRQLERSSKFLDTQRRCGHFKSNITDEYDHPEERVVNGTVAKRGRHPWQATIRTRGRGGVSSHWCGAVLISKKHLLTAAHCLAGYPKGAYFIRMGDHYANIAESSEIDSFIENWYIHEKFRDGTHMNNDIALIVLKSQVRFNDYIQPVCLPEKGAALQESRMCTISGWGSIKSGMSAPSNILRAAQLPILADETCKRSHVYGASMSEGMFCAGYMDENVDACDGDSGGPLICTDDDGETLYGIISWGQHCGYANKPGVYVRVEKYIDWIYDKVNYSLQNAG